MRCQFAFQPDLVHLRKRLEVIAGLGRFTLPPTVVRIQENELTEKHLSLRALCAIKKIIDAGPALGVPGSLESVAELVNSANLNVGQEICDERLSAVGIH
jgi:hypothetical protein